MIVAGLQTDIVWEDPPANFSRVEARVEALLSGSGPRPDLLVLPEMFATGFSMEAERVAAFAGTTREFLSALARRLGIHLLAGYAEPAGPRPANACSIVDPSGEEILHYRKLHPFSLSREDEHYLPGEKLAGAEVAGTRITPLICYDLRFPEPFRAAAEDTDLFCVIANWPSKRRFAWSTLLRARAIENQSYVLGLNRVGEGSGEPHTGDSALLDPLGGEVALPLALEASEGPAPMGEGWVVGEVDPGEVRRVRRRFTFLADRRPELYLRLEAERRISRS